MNIITQAMISAGPGACRIDSGDWYVVEDLTYPFDYGAAIQNTEIGGNIRIFGQGHRLINMPGGGPYNGTRAWGLRFLACHVEIRSLAIGNGPELGKFFMPLDLSLYADSIGNPNYASGPGRHYIDDVVVSGWAYGARVQGNDCLYRRVDAVDCGGGTGPYSQPAQRPIGLDHWGPRPVMIDCYSLNMTKGPYDQETMSFHFEDAHDGVFLRGVGSNITRTPLSFGIWFNSTERFRMIQGNFAGSDLIFAGDTHNSRLEGYASNYATLSSIPSDNTVLF